MDLKSLIQQLSAFADGLLAAPHFRARVHYAEHIYDSLGEIEELLPSLVVPDKSEGAVLDGEQVQGSPAFPHPTDWTKLQESLAAMERHGPLSPPRFKKMTLVAAAKVLLLEYGQLHGKRIEQLVKAGGYRTRGKHFQNTMTVTFKRDGGFENVGGNTWRLKLPSEEPRVSETVPPSVNGASHN